MKGDDKKYYKERLLRAREQRWRALKNAFATIDCYAECSLNPEDYGYYEVVKKRLTKIYSNLKEE